MEGVEKIQEEFSSFKQGTMKYILIFFAFWGWNISAQTPNTLYTNHVVVSNNICDSTLYSYQYDYTITIVGSIMTITPSGEFTRVHRVELLGQDWEGTYYYEYDKGSVAINPFVPYVTIQTEYGCIDYFNLPRP